MTELQHQQLINLLVQQGLDPKIFNNPIAVQYITQLLDSPLQELLKEPDNLANLKLDLDNQWSDVTCKEYKSFIDAHLHLADLGSHFAKLPKELVKINEFIPSISDYLRNCQTCHEESINTKDTLQSIASQLDQLEPLLEVPVLFDTLIGNGHFEEAMDLQLFAQRLPVRYPDVPFLQHLASIKAGSETMLVQLLSMLRGPVKLPLCIRVIGYLRRLGFPDTSLRVLFLSLRYEYLMGLLTLVKEAQPQDYVRRWIETQREHLFDLITHYNAIFPESSIRHVSIDCQILSSFAVHSVSLLIKILADFLSKTNDMSLLPSLNTQVMYYGMSLGRVGLDFRPLIVPMFEDTVKRIIDTAFQDASDSFDVSESQIERPSVDCNPQDLLFKSHSVATLYNHYVTALNQLRYLPCKSLHKQLSTDLQKSLSVVIDKVLQEHGNRKRDMEITAWILSHGLIPQITLSLDLVLDGAKTDYTPLLHKLEPLVQLGISHGVSKEVPVTEMELEIEQDVKDQAMPNDYQMENDFNNTNEEIENEQEEDVRPNTNGISSVIHDKEESIKSEEILEPNNVKKNTVKNEQNLQSQP